MIYTKFTEDSTQKKLLTFNAVRSKFFWSNNFLTAKEKRCFNQERNIFVYVIYVAWSIGFAVAIMTLTMPFEYPKYMFVDKWHFIFKKSVRFFVFLLLFCGYYIENSGISYYAYGILHSYFQMIILRRYIKKTIKNCGKHTLKDKVSDKNYQREMQVIFKRCIHHYQKLKW